VAAPVFLYFDGRPLLRVLKDGTVMLQVQLVAIDLQHLLSSDRMAAEFFIDVHSFLFGDEFDHEADNAALTGSLTLTFDRLRYFLRIRSFTKFNFALKSLDFLRIVAFLAFIVRMISWRMLICIIWMENASSVSICLPRPQVIAYCLMAAVPAMVPPPAMAVVMPLRRDQLLALPT